MAKFAFYKGRLFKEVPSKHECSCDGCDLDNEIDFCEGLGCDINTFFKRDFGFMSEGDTFIYVDSKTQLKYNCKVNIQHPQGCDRCFFEKRNIPCSMLCASITDTGNFIEEKRHAIT